MGKLQILHQWLNQKASFTKLWSIGKLAAGNIAYGFSQWLMIALIFRVEGPIELGSVALVLAITVPLQTLLQLAHRHFQSVYSDDEFRFSSFIQIRAVSILIFITIMIAIGGVLSAFDLVSMEITLAIVVLRIAESFADLIQGAFNRIGLQGQMALSGIIRAIVCSACFFVLIGWYENTSLAIFSAGLLTLIYQFVFDIPKALRCYSVSLAELFKANFGEVQSILVRTLPLGISYAIVMFQPNIPRYSIEVFAGPSDLGIYTALVAFIVVGNFPVAAASMVALPQLSSAVQSGDLTQFNRVMGKLIVLAATAGLCGVIIVWFAGDTILTLIYGEKTLGWQPIFIGMMFAGLANFIGSVIGAAATSVGKYETLIVNYSATTMASVFMTCYLTLYFGLEGGILGFAISSVFNALASRRIVRLAIHKD